MVRSPVPVLGRRKLRLKPLNEAEAYARCHGERYQQVRIVQLPPRRPRYEVLASGEELRRSFEDRLDARDILEGSAFENL